MDNLNAQKEGDKNRLVKNKLAKAAIWLKSESSESVFLVLLVHCGGSSGKILCVT